MFGLQGCHEYIYLFLCNGCQIKVKNVKITVHDTKQWLGMHFHVSEVHAELMYCIYGKVDTLVNIYTISNYIS